MANRRQVLFLRTNHPEMTSGEIADRLDCDSSYVRSTLSRARAAAGPQLPKVRKPPGSNLTFSPTDIDELIRLREIECKSWREISIVTGRPLSTCSSRYAEEKKPEIYRKYAGVDRPKNVPDHILEDARRRTLAPRSITSFLCGDPAPGQSALDKREGVFA